MSKEKVEEEAEEIIEDVEEEVAAKPKERVKEAAEKPKVRKREEKISSYYKIGETGVERLRPFCERCGPGYFMADHGDRFACGHCGFTRYKRAEEV